MNAAKAVALRLTSEIIFGPAAALSRLSAQKQHPLSSAGGDWLSGRRHYRSRPTHGIGRYKHLLIEEAPKKKKEKLQMKEISAGTDFEFGALNIQVSGYDMTLVEHYAQYVHCLCNSLNVKVEESYGLPTKTTEVMMMQEQGSKMYLDAVLTTHERIVQAGVNQGADTRVTRADLEEEGASSSKRCTSQCSKASTSDSTLPLSGQGWIISHLSSTLAPILLEILQRNQPEGVKLQVKEHTEADYQMRFKARPELEGLMAQVI